MVISFVGYRATGKTTVAMLLAERLVWRGMDTDAEIQRLAGQSIRAIFANQGEAKFRDYESQVIHKLTRRHKVVLSLGGGAVMREQNRQALAVAGPVIWLAASAETICCRLENDPNTQHQRPSLTGRAPDEEVRQVLKQRIPIYSAIADLTVQTDALTPSQIVDRVMADLDLSPATRLS